MYGCNICFEGNTGDAFFCPGGCGAFYILPEQGSLGISHPDFHATVTPLLVMPSTAVEEDAKAGFRVEQTSFDNMDEPW